MPVAACWMVYVAAPTALVDSPLATARALIVSLPLSMAVSTVTSSMLQMAMGPQMGNMTATTPAESQKIFAMMMHAFGLLWPYYAALQFVNFILQAGLTVGAAANAYNLVTGGSEIAPPPAKAMA